MSKQALQELYPISFHNILQHILIGIDHFNIDLISFKLCLGLDFNFF